MSIDENFPLKVFISNFYDDFLESSIDLTVRTAATNLDVTITRAHEGYPPEQSRVVYHLYAGTNRPRPKNGREDPKLVSKMALKK